MKRVILLFSVLACVNFITAQDLTGLCGENLYWEFHPEDSTLEVKGYGRMANFDDYYDGAPWHSYMSIIKEVRLPEALTSISSHAFGGAWRIEKVNIPLGVTSIGEYAFASCAKLFDIVVPDGVRTIGQGAFNGVANVTYHGPAYGSPWGAKGANGFIVDGLLFNNSSKEILLACSPANKGVVSIPDGTKKIEKYSFYGCKYITEVIIPQSVNEMGERVFCDCDLLAGFNVDSANMYYCSENGVLYNKDKKILVCYPDNKPGKTFNIPSSVEILGVLAFHSSNNIESIEIPSGVRFIHAECFGGCKALKNVKFNEGLLAIRDKAFWYSTSLNSIELPESLCELGEGAFARCSALESINIPSKITTIKSETFQGCGSLKGIYTGDKVTKIEDSAFKECYSLEYIGTSDRLEVIEKWAFAYCDKLKTINLGSGLQRIDKYAFTCGNRIGTCFLTCKAYRPPYTDDTAFSSWNTYFLRIFVPRSSVNEYSNSSPWYKFDIKASN